MNSLMWYLGSYILGAIIFGGWVKSVAHKHGATKATGVNTRAVLVLAFVLSDIVAPVVVIVAVRSGLLPLARGTSDVEAIRALLLPAAIGQLTLDYMFLVLIGTAWWRSSIRQSARIFLGWFLGWSVLTIAGVLVMVAGGAALSAQADSRSAPAAHNAQQEADERALAEATRQRLVQEVADTRRRAEEAAEAQRRAQEAEQARAPAHRPARDGGARHGRDSFEDLGL